MLNLVSVYSSQYSNVQYIKNITNKEIRTKIDPNPQLAKYISYLLNNKYSPYSALELANRNKRSHCYCFSSNRISTLHSPPSKKYFKICVIQR